jgi:hypothetical protein
MNRRQEQALRALWNADDLEWKVFADAPAEVKRDIEQTVLDQLEAEGKHIHPGAGNLFGAERARRELQLFAGWVYQQLSESKQVVQTVCRDVKYCERRQAKTFESEGVTVSIAVADALVSSAIGVPIPIIQLTVYIIKRGILDQICECS